MTTPTSTRCEATAPRRAGAGFTLVELLVAISLMAIVSLISWRGLEGVASLRTGLQHNADRTESLLRMLGQLERDLHQRAPDMMLVALDTAAGMAGRDAPPLRMPRAVTILAQKREAADTRLEIIRAGVAPGTWQQVAWWVQDGVLMRSAGASTDVYPLPEPGPGAAIMTQVSAFEIQGWVPTLGWQPLPLGTEAGAPVAGIEIDIVLQSGAERYQRIIAFQ